MVRNLDEGGTIDVTYCDFMKAFNKVPLKRLLYKIEKYGMVGNIHVWSESFLSNRKQCVVINNKISAPAPVTSSIPQGSVLGPLSFVIYILITCQELSIKIAMSSYPQMTLKFLVI